MKKLFITLAITLLLCGCGKKEEPKAKPEPPDKVYVTQFGENYHRLGCSELEGQGATMGMTYMKAEDKGYHPCEICQPPSSED